MKHPHSPKAKLIFLLLFISFTLLLSRIFYLQVIKSELAQKASSQQSLYEKLMPMRGTIYDRNQQALAMSVDVYTVKAIPFEVENPSLVAQQLSPILGKTEKILGKTFKVPQKGCVS